MVPDEIPLPVEPDSSKNLVIVAVLAVIVVVLALMFMWGTRIEEQPAPEVIPPVETPVVEQAPVSVPVSTSDDVDTLENELVMPEIETLDDELQNLEAALDEELNAL